MRRQRHRGNGEGSVVKSPGRKKPWAAVITVGWTIEGRPIRRARYASSEREAKALLAELRDAHLTARPLPDDRMTVGRWLVEWFKGLELRPNSIEAYERSVRLLLPELGNVPLRKLRSTQVSEALRNLDRSPHTVAGARSVLSTAIREAQRAGLVATNEAALAKAPRISRKGLPAPDTATVRAVLAELAPHRLSALYVLLAGTGLRIGEATGLRWEDLSDGRGMVGALEGGDGGLDSVHRSLDSAYPIDRGPLVGSANRGSAPAVALASLTVRYQLQRINGEHVLTDPKTDTAGRLVILGATVQAALRDHRRRQAEERIRAGRKWRDTGLVFTTIEGQPVSEQTAHWTLSRACERAGTRHLSLHDFRRYAATTITDAIGRDAAQRVLGHTSGTMTERYVTLTDPLLVAAAGALEEALG